MSYLGLGEFSLAEDLVCLTLIKKYWKGRLGAQSVKRSILGLGSGHRLMVCEFEPHVGLCADSEEPARDSLSPLLSASPLLMLSLPLSLKVNKSAEKNTG